MPEFAKEKKVDNVDDDDDDNDDVDDDNDDVDDDNDDDVDANFYSVSLDNLDVYIRLRAFVGMFWEKKALAICFTWAVKNKGVYHCQKKSSGINRALCQKHVAKRNDNVISINY